MAQFVFANNVSTTLAAPVGSTANTITLSSSANFPTIPTGYVWAITLNDAATKQIFEVVYVTANLGGGQLQVLRGQEGTTPQSWQALDLVFGAVTAGALASFLNAASLSNFVQLSPPTAQTGSINVSGSISTTGAGSFGAGVAVGGTLSGATTGYFSSELRANDFVSTVAYANTAIANLGLKFSGAGGTIGVGPSSGLSSSGVTGSALAIGSSATGKVVVIDTSGNLAASGNMYSAGSLSVGAGIGAGSGTFTGALSAPSITQNGLQVLSQLTSSDNSVALGRSGASYNISVASSPAILKWYLQNGTQQPNPKIVSGSTYCGGGTTAVTLSGSAAFTNAGTYTVVTAVAYGAPASTAPAYPQNVSGSQFNLYQANASTCNWVAIGY